MSLYQNTVLLKYLKSQNTQLIAEKWKVFQSHFQNPVIQENIKNSKEEQYQGEFLIDLFVNVLGYMKNPYPNFNLTTEYKNVKDSKKADGAIIIDNKVLGIIELKGMNTTDLSKIEEQAFGYKNNQPDCKYVITSNFEKLRFYIDNAVDYLEFNLFNLSENEFKVLYLTLAFENIQADLPSRIKSESISQEDVITKKLYKDYSVFKRELFSNLTILNPDYEPIVLFKKSQKLLDRFLFLFFAEDRHLLPVNYTRSILLQWEKVQELDIDEPLYDRFKKHFNYLNTGYKGKEFEVFPYNGGLFLPDSILDEFIIDDKLLYKHSLKLSEYNFESEVDVNILGHIFENSLNEIEEIQAALEGQAIDKSKTKRKKEGVFYTPKYITKYIVENTIGKLCEEKKAELAIDEEDYITDKKRQKKTIKDLVDKLDIYRNWLLQLTICDPACGSGAFLNQALDFLIKEHKYIDELQAKLFGDALVLTDIENSILENNLFGVDLNEESVEIAKLSLWLRTAQPNRKLNDLSGNIKCGNSLIDDPEIVGNKAFDWEKEFPQVFAKGGFDVVIGNPPYVQLSKLETTTQEERNFLLDKYQTSAGRLNTYIYFIHLLQLILKDNGFASYIIPNTILTQEYYAETRRLFIEKINLTEVVQYSYLPFADAIVENITLFFRKNMSVKYINITEQTPNDVRVMKTLDTSSIKTAHKNIIQLNFSEITNKLDKIENKLDDFVEINQAIALKGDKSLSVKNEFKPHYYKLIDGKHINKYLIKWGGDYLEHDLDRIHSCKRKDIFESKEKLFFRRVSSNLIFTFDNEQYFALNTIVVVNLREKVIIPLKALLAILNSKLLNYYYTNKYKSTKTVFSEIQARTVKLLPIPNILENESNYLLEKADQMLSLNKELQEISPKFHRTLERKFELETLPKKLQEWYELNFAEFVKELGKKKIKLSLSEEGEWEDYFLQEQQKALEIKAKIEATDKEIDQMVYELYGLTPEEIEIVENS